MYHFIKKLFGNTTAARISKRQDRRARLGIDVLEDRQMMTASPAAAPIEFPAPPSQAAYALQDAATAPNMSGTWKNEDGYMFTLVPLGTDTYTKFSYPGPELCEKYGWPYGGTFGPKESVAKITVNTSATRTSLGNLYAQEGGLWGTIYQSPGSPIFIQTFTGKATRVSAATTPQILPEKPAKPDIRMDKIWIDNGKMYFTYEITGKITQDQFRTHLVLSFNDSYSNDDKTLATLRFSGSQLSEGKHTAMVTLGAKGQVKVPGAGLPEVDGKYYLIARADFDGKISETSGKNNDAVMANPDISLEKVWVEKGRIYYTYDVTGWIPKQKVYVRLAQSSDASFSSNDAPLDNFYLTGTQLTKGQHTVYRTIGSGKGQVRLPSAGLTASAADGYLVARIDPDNKLGESSETNNDAATRPDVRVTNARFNGSARSVAFDLATNDVSESFVVSLYQSNAATFSLSTATKRATMTVDPKETSGIFILKDALKVVNGGYLFVVADPAVAKAGGSLFEVNEKNNIATVAPDLEIQNVWFNTPRTNVSFSYAAWNLSGVADVRLYQSDSPMFDAAKGTQLAQKSVSVKGTTATFQLFTAPVWADGRYLFVVANPLGMKLEKNPSNNVARLDLPDVADPSKTNQFRIRINRGLDVAIGNGGLQGLEFLIEPVFQNGETGPYQKLTYTAIAASKGLKIGVSGTSDWVTIRTNRLMTVEDFQGTGSIITYPGVSAGPLGGTDTYLTLYFGTMEISFVANAGGIGASLGGVSTGVWTVQ